MSADQPHERLRGSLAFTALLWLVSAYIVVGAIGFPYPANVAPLLLGGTAAALLTWIVINLAARRVGRRADTECDRDTSRAASAGAELSRDEVTVYDRERGAITWIAASIVLLIVLGFLVGTTIAMIGLLRVYSKERWSATISTTAVVMLTLYLAFGVALNVPLYWGAFGLFL